MFLERWLMLLEKQSFFLALVAYLLLGVGIGIFSWRWRRVFFFWSSFFSLFAVLGRERWLDFRWWVVAVGVALWVALWRRAERVGQFFLGFWTMGNFFTFLLVLSQDVELLRFLTRFPFRIWLVVAVMCGFLALYRYFLHLFSALLGSALFMVGYVRVLERSNVGEFFWDEPPFLAFLFLVLTVFLYALREWV